MLFGAYARRAAERRRTSGATDEDERGDLTFGLAIGGTVVAAGIAATWALAEHASTGIQPGIAMPVDIAAPAGRRHLARRTRRAAGRAVPGARDRSSGAAVRRFSRVAFGSVLVLVATGIYQSWRQVGSWSALTGTSYGQLLLVKIGLVAVLVGIAWISRRWTARLRREHRRRREAAERHGDGPRPPTAETRNAVAAGVAEPTRTPERAAQLARQQAAVRQRAAEAGCATPTRERVGPAPLGARRGRRRRGPARRHDHADRRPSPAVPQEQARPTRRLLVAPPPPRRTAPGAMILDMPFDTGGQNGKGTVRLDLDPARVGANEMHVYVDRPRRQGRSTCPR